MNRIFASFTIAALAVAGIMALSAAKAEAARYRFGTDEALHSYAKTGMTHEKKPVDLCYKTSTYNVFAPVYTTDEMVLCDVSKKMYWPVPAGEQLKQLQAAGLMPKPVPSYERPTFDYVLGFGLWLGLSVVGAVMGISALFGRKKAEGEEPEEQAA